MVGARRVPERGVWSVRAGGIGVVGRPAVGDTSGAAGAAVALMSEPGAAVGWRCSDAISSAQSCGRSPGSFIIMRRILS